ncbi:hypothetical protein COO20_03915 [Thalassospira marina]|uniref:YjiS-like domain-containing protein n=1 Tax=Thalassospira marina TaxID=2048283 RepID=A0A2N3KXM3_9PROT|nr:hypothetical protein COO20_03915 [Thalassospira marina]
MEFRKMPCHIPISHTADSCPTKKPLTYARPQIALTIKYVIRVVFRRTCTFITGGLNHFLDRVNGFFDVLAQRLSARRQKRLDVRVMNDRQLADIGLSRYDVEDDYAKSSHWNFHLKN